MDGGGEGGDRGLELARLAARLIVEETKDRSKR